MYLSLSLYIYIAGPRGALVGGYPYADCVYEAFHLSHSLYLSLSLCMYIYIYIYISLTNLCFCGVPRSSAPGSLLASDV